MVDADDPSWTLDLICLGQYDENVVPSLATTRRLVAEMHRKMVVGTLTRDTLLSWMERNFSVALDALKWEAVDVRVIEEQFRIAELHRWLKHHNAYDAVAQRSICDIARVVYNVRECALHIGRLFRNTDPYSLESRNYVPKEIREDDAYVLATATPLDDKLSDKNTNFQNAFVQLTRFLECLSLRRTSGRFFKRVITPSGLQALAFVEEMTISDFVGHYTSHAINFQLFKQSTNPTSNYERLIETLKSRPLPEAPDLNENCDLRSFAGDPYGRGAGIYDSRSDMFWPYAAQPNWSVMAARVQHIRRRLNPEYTCTLPASDDVCVVHLETAFPYDIYGELCELPRTSALSWRNAHPFECERCHEVHNQALADALEELLPPIGEDATPVRVGHAWQRVCGAASVEHLCNVSSPGLQSELDASTSPIVYVTTRDDGWVEKCVAYDSHGEAFVPLVTPVSSARARVDASLINGRVVARSFVRTASGRFFRVDAGRTYRDCDASEIDHIYKCQKFSEHDIFFLFGLKGRLFFEVGELDSHEMSLMIEGIGGSGKSTAIKAHEPFWPSHLKGHLSSNMQADFGMSQLVKCKVIFCNEVSSDLTIKQEEWQTSVSGEWSSYNRKFQDAIVCKWIGQHFWVGNAFPTKFNNGQGQVSRRLAGVLFAHSISPRDGKILDHIRTKLGSLLRKDILAYHEFVAITGNVDPMSVPDTLPPAFADYYRRGRQLTDPVEAFLSDGSYVVVDPAGVMLMSEFKELYSRYRHDYDMGKALRWSDACYRTPFNERGISVRKMTEVNLDGETHTNVHVVYGVKPVTS